MRRVYAARALSLHASSARTIVREDGPPELAENAYLAAISLAAELDLFETARRLYEEAARISRARRGTRGPAPAGRGSPRVGRGSKIARQCQGNSSSAESSTRRLDRRRPSSGNRGAAPPRRAPRSCSTPWNAWTIGAIARPSITRRREDEPSLGRLVALDVEAMSVLPPLDAAAAASELLRLLGGILDYRILSPLEGMASHPLAEIRARAVEVAGRIAVQAQHPYLAKGLERHRSARRAASRPARSHTKDAGGLRRSPPAPPRARWSIPRDPRGRAWCARWDRQRRGRRGGPERTRDRLVARAHGRPGSDRRAPPDRSGKLFSAARARLGSGVPKDVERDLVAVLGAQTRTDLERT